MSPEQYLKKWIPLNEKMRQENFLWGTVFENDEWVQYMSYDIYKMPKHQWNHIIKATQEIAQILQKTYKILCDDEALFLKLGLPVSTHALKNVISRYFSYFARLDLIVNGDDIKVIEINCDTPLGFLETSVCNRILCEEHDCQSPNHLEENLQLAWEQIKQDYSIKPTDAIYFTSDNWHDEERETVQLIRNNCLNQQTRYIHIGNIVFSENGLFTPKGEKIDYLYRLYPLEFLALHDEGIDEKKGQLFIDHIAKGVVKVINPPSAFIMQSKAVMAIVYSFLSQASNFFTSEELSLIDKYFLPTYFDDRVFKEQAYVAKPFWGREGGGISIFDHEKNVIDEDRMEYYYRQEKVYQKYIEMPETTISTWDGDYTGKLLIGSFVINGTPSGLFLRVGERIVGTSSMFCGITTDMTD
jgi:glutathionylspermidine synthase